MIHIHTVLIATVLIATVLIATVLIVTVLIATVLIAWGQHYSIEWNTKCFATLKSQRSCARETEPEREVDHLNKCHITGHQKCVLCTETEHFPDGTSEMYTVYKTEHFPDGTNKAVFTDHKTSLNKGTHRFTVIHIYQHMQLTHNKSHT